MILVVDMNGKKDSLGFHEFVLPIASVINELDDYVVKHYLEIVQEDVAQCNAVVLSGTPLKDNSTLTQLEKFEWIKSFQNPILGICAGMQTIALVFGGGLTKCLGVGMTEITTLKENALFSSTFKAYGLHNFSVAASLEFDVLAESAQCIQAVKHKHRNVYGVLFHPEVRNQEILHRFVRMFSLHRRV
jgi:GMP synthase-like glutamine amidotransferase